MKNAGLSLLTPSTVVLLLAWIGACGGGGSGSGDDGGDPSPAPAPLATRGNTGLAVGGRFDRVASIGQFLLVPVSELEMGTDLNGDGDTLDLVATAVDTVNDVQRNLGLAIVGEVLGNGTHFAMLVSEAGQGGVDLDFDGDAADTVWHIYNPLRQLGATNPFNSGLGATPLGLPGIGTKNGFVVIVAEAAIGNDLNGDADTFDLIAVAIDTRTLNVLIFPTGTYQPNTPLVARNGRVLLTGTEQGAAVDMNMDGDQSDLVLLAVEFNTLNPFLRGVGGFAPRATNGRPYALTDNAAVYLIDEAGDGGLDLNTDGDIADGVIAVFDLATASGEFFPLSPIIPAFGVAGDNGVGIVTSADRALFGISEFAQQGRDLNGDMDAFDRVLGWIDTRNNPSIVRVLPLALGQKTMRIEKHKALIAVSETGMGAIFGVDLNLDGDTADDVAHVIEISSFPATVTNLSLAVSALSLQGDDALLAVPEAGQRGGDLNGDGVADDIVYFYFDFADNPETRLPLAIAPAALTLFRYADDEVRLAAIIPEGHSPTFRDINGDGDEDDHALVLLGIDPSVQPPKLRARTPFFAGTASIFSHPPLRLGDLGFAFAASETMAGIDFNGDGDMDDTVVQVVLYTVEEAK